MDLGLHITAAAILATAEFCANPIDGGVGEPQFCRLDAVQEISTPYFSITVEPEFLVGVGNQGRHLQIQPSLWQSPAVLTVKRTDGSDPPDLADCPASTERHEGVVIWRDCRVGEGDLHLRQIVALLSGAYVLIEYSYSALGTTLAPALERMTQSIRVHAI